MLLDIEAGSFICNYGVVLLESLNVGLSDKKAFPDTGSGKPPLANHPANRLSVKAPPMV
jgi:hypothetical protein